MEYVIPVRFDSVVEFRVTAGGLDEAMDEVNRLAAGLDKGGLRDVDWTVGQPRPAI